MNRSKIPEFISLFEDFKKTEDYTFRKTQSAICPIAKRIISETLKNEPLTNGHLTGLIQMLKADGSRQSFEKYLSLNIKDPEVRNNILSGFIQLGHTGYTGAGRAAIRSLSSSQLSEVKNFLSTAFTIGTIEQAKTLTDNFDSLHIPELKQGIYSPWLHYINPTIFPVINGSHNDLLFWFEINRKYSSCIEDYGELMKLTGEPDLSNLDFFAYKVKLNSNKESLEALAERLLKEKADSAQIKQAFTKAYKQKKNITDDKFIEERVEAYMNLAKRRAKEKDTAKTEINVQRFDDAFFEYLEACKETNWLSEDELYKFKFGRWLNEKVNFKIQTDQEILDLCNKSQEEKYDGRSSGVNFLISTRRFGNEILELSDIGAIREIFQNGEIREEKLTGTISLPKFSAWLATLLPEQFNTCPNIDLIYSLEYLFGKKISHRGFESFIQVQELLAILRSELQKNIKEFQNIYSAISGLIDFKPVDEVWFVQDFILYISRKILVPKEYLDAEISESTNNSDIKFWLYAPGENAHMWEEFYNNGVMGLGWEKLGDLNNYKSKQDIENKLQEIAGNSDSKRNDATANYEFKNGISIGDIIIVKKGRRELLGYGEVTSDYYFDNSKPHYQKFRKIRWIKKGAWKTDHDLALKTLTDITKYRVENSGYDYYYESLLGLINDSDNRVRPKIKLNYALNTIFYGPPGTGKTYNTVLRSAQIVEERLDLQYEEALKIFNKNIRSQIEFITFHQNYSYEDFIQGLRPDIENESELRFERKDGIFKRISDRALKNLLESERPDKAKQQFSEVFAKFIDPLNNGEIEELEVRMKKVSFFVNNVTNRSIEFRKSGGDSKHSLSIDTLRKMYEKEVNDLIIGGLQPYYNSLLSVLLEMGKNSVVPIERKNFVLIIDEINRANISRVFGELITLIECDKRSHGAFPMKCTLPSGEEFMVPSNLYIIGTMNTADKSIALLDIALRRRFDFEPMYPLYNIEGHKIHYVDILKKINEKIRALKGCDFQIGHAYFMDNSISLAERMNKRVIPLLLEYFMNDETEVKGILTYAGLTLEADSWPLKINGNDQSL